MKMLQDLLHAAAMVTRGLKLHIYTETLYK
jgi:hypothetical protein